MNQGAALEMARHGMQVAMMVAFPMLAVSLFVGLMVSVFQAVTQVQEMTLTFVPKLIGIGAVIVFMGGWMLTTIVSFTTLCFEQMAKAGH